ncbi:hypothetical protein [Streptomyces sp. 3N207]|uniref:hypothetical protein n=1 Tax=Streptomyces sp. 3N207 TaxID=3457417 RepID=UPI003FD5DB35
MPAPAPHRAHHAERSHASGPSTTPLLGNTNGENLDRTVALHPDRDALVDVSNERRWSYRQFAADVEALAPRTGNGPGHATERIATGGHAGPRRTGRHRRHPLRRRPGQHPVHRAGHSPRTCSIIAA